MIWRCLAKKYPKHWRQNASCIFKFGMKLYSDNQFGLSSSFKNNVSLAFFSLWQFDIFPIKFLTNSQSWPLKGKTHYNESSRIPFYSLHVCFPFFTVYFTIIKVMSIVKHWISWHVLIWLAITDWDHGKVEILVLAAYVAGLFFHFTGCCTCCARQSFGVVFYPIKPLESIVQEKPLLHFIKACMCWKY